MGNPRYIKVAEQIKVIVAELIERRIKDPRLGDFVTVTDVRLTGDGREATVFYTVLGGEEERVELDVGAQELLPVSGAGFAQPSKRGGQLDQACPLLRRGAGGRVARGGRLDGGAQLGERA